MGYSYLPNAYPVMDGVLIFAKAYPVKVSPYLDDNHLH